MGKRSEQASAIIQSHNHRSVNKDLREVLLIAVILALLLSIPAAAWILRKRRQAEQRAKLAAQKERDENPNREPPLVVPSWLLLALLLLPIVAYQWFLSFTGKASVSPLAMLGLLLITPPFLYGGLVVWLSLRDRSALRTINQANAGDLQARIGEVRREAEKEGLSALRANALGCLLMQRNEWDEAIKMFEEAERLGLDRSIVGSNLGLALMLSGKPNMALPVLEQAARANPNEIVSQCNLCLVLLDLGRSEEASKQLSRIEQLRKQRRVLLAVAPSKRSQIDQAIGNCRAQLAGKPVPGQAAIDKR
jgi:tetratricopeptide (TPR) repeat protein